MRAWIELTPLRVAWLPLLKQEARARAAHSSTSIEGNPLTLSQVQAIDRGEKTGVPRNQEKEVANYLKAMRWIEKNAALKITGKTVLHLHKILMRDLFPLEKTGKYKTKPNFIVDEKGIRVFTPPSPKETPKLMRELLNWLNAREAKDLHSVLLCAILHHRLASIHPFSDGNGRLARALGTMILYRRGFDTRHIFSLDDFFAGDRKRYYQKLQQARELDDDLSLWIEYVAEGVVCVLREVKKRVEQLQVSSISKINLSARQEEILGILRDNPSMSGAELIARMKITRSRLNQLLSPLIQANVIIKEGRSRATRYRLSA